MKKYFYIFKTAITEKISYLLNLLFTFIFFCLIIFILLSIWNYIYADTQIINGYLLNQVMWYVLLAEVLWFGGHNPIFIDDVSNDIKTGNIACKINKPYNYIFFSLAKYLGDIFLQMIVFLLIGIFIGCIFIDFIQNFNIKSILPIVTTYTFGIIINSLIYIIISLSSFWFEENKPFIWIYDKIIVIFGIVFPLEMLPDWLKPLTMYTPVFVSVYGPVKLTIDFSMNIFYKVMTAQFLWFIGLIILALYIYQKGAKKINSNGG